MPPVFLDKSQYFSIKLGNYVLKSGSFVYGAFRGQTLRKAPINYGDEKNASGNWSVF